MDHQDWKPVVLNSASDANKKAINKDKAVANSQYTPNPESFKLEAPTNLASTISNARTARGKTQKVLANELGMSSQIIARWESGKEIPDNAQIAKIEKHLGVKLPRCKKVQVKD